MPHGEHMTCAVCADWYDVDLRLCRLLPNPTLGVEP